MNEIMAQQSESAQSGRGIRRIEPVCSNIMMLRRRIPRETPWGVILRTSAKSVGFGNDRNRPERNSRHRRLLCQLYSGQTFVGFCNDVVDHCFHVLRPLPNRDLAVRAGALMQNSFDLVNLAPAPEFRHFVSDEFYEFVNETARFGYALLDEIDKISLDSV